MGVITAETAFLTSRRLDVVDTEGGDLGQETQRHPSLTVTYLAPRHLPDSVIAATCRVNQDYRSPKRSFKWTD